MLSPGPGLKSLCSWLETPSACAISRSRMGLARMKTERTGWNNEQQPRAKKPSHRSTRDSGCPETTLEAPMTTTRSTASLCNIEIWIDSLLVRNSFTINLTYQYYGLRRASLGMPNPVSAMKRNVCLDIGRLCYQYRAFSCSNNAIQMPPNAK